MYGLDGGEFAPDKVDEEFYHLKKRWRRVQELVKHFLGQWIKEWLPGLNKRHKWFKKEKDSELETLLWSYQQKANKENGYSEGYQMCFQEKTIMYKLRKLKLRVKNTFHQYPKCAPLNAKTLRGLINQSLSKKGRMIIRKYNDNEILYKRTNKAKKISRIFQN